jgi:probable phosphoglycerate mutase
LVTHPGIVEFDRDSGTYIPMEELKREDYAAWKALADGDHGADIHGFQKTVVEALEELIARHASQSIAVFCHGGVINVWTAHILGMQPRLFFEPVYTSIHRYRCARTGQRNLVGLNEIAHLR